MPNPLDPHGKPVRGKRPRNPKARNAHKKAGRRAARPRKGKSLAKLGPQCKRLKCTQDNVTGWCVYHKGGGVLLTPGPICAGDGFEPGYPKKGGRGLGFSGDIGAGAGGNVRAARSAAILREFTGAEVGGVQAGIIGANAAAGGSRAYGNIAAAIYAGNPEKYTPLAPGYTGAGPLARPIGPGIMGRILGNPRGAPVGPSVREGCRCTPRDPDSQDPVSGWLIYYVGGGVLLTPTCKCIGGGGGPKDWLAQTWINVKTLFGSPPPSGPPLPPPEFTGLDAIASRVGPDAVPPVCVPDEIISRDTSPFGSGWFRVNRPGVGPLLVPNPKTCP